MPHYVATQGTLDHPFSAGIRSDGLCSQHKAEEALNQAMTAAYTSDDLTVADQIRVPEVLKAEFEKRRNAGLGAAETGTDDLDQVVQGAMSINQALLQGKRSLSDLLL